MASFVDRVRAIVQPMLVEAITGLDDSPSSELPALGRLIYGRLVAMLDEDLLTRRTPDAILQPRESVPEGIDVPINPERLAFSLVPQAPSLPFNQDPGITMAIDGSGDLIYYSDDYPEGVNIGHVTGDGLSAYAPDFEIVDGHLILTDPLNPSGLDLGDITGPAGTNGIDGEDGLNGVQGEKGADADISDILKTVTAFTELEILKEIGALRGQLMSELASLVQQMRTDIYHQVFTEINHRQPQIKVVEDGEDRYLSFSYDGGNSWVDDDVNIRGAQGIQGIQGTQGVQGVKGDEPDIFIQFIGYSLYIYVDGLLKVNKDIRGEQGPQGPQGPAGINAPEYHYYYCPA